MGEIIVLKIPAGHITILMDSLMDHLIKIIQALPDRYSEILPMSETISEIEKAIKGIQELDERDLQKMKQRIQELSNLCDSVRVAHGAFFSAANRMVHTV